MAVLEKICVTNFYISCLDDRFYYEDMIWFDFILLLLFYFICKYSGKRWVSNTVSIRAQTLEVARLEEGLLCFLCLSRWRQIRARIKEHKS